MQVLLPPWALEGHGYEDLVLAAMFPPSPLYTCEGHSRTLPLPTSLRCCISRKEIIPIGVFTTAYAVPSCRVLLASKHFPGVETAPFFNSQDTCSLAELPLARRELPVNSCLPRWPTVCLWSVSSLNIPSFTVLGLPPQLIPVWSQEPTLGSHSRVSDMTWDVTILLHFSFLQQ